MMISLSCEKLGGWEFCSGLGSLVHCGIMGRGAGVWEDRDRKLISDRVFVAPLRYQKNMRKKFSTAIAVYSRKLLYRMRVPNLLGDDCLQKFVH